MIKVKKEGILLEKTQLEFENEGVLNPAVIYDGGSIHMFYRAVRQGNFSTIGYCRLSDPVTVAERNDTPVLVPEFDHELQGVEDPRITKIDGQFYITYTAYDGVNALGALAVSDDLKTFTKLGIIVPRITYEKFNYFTRLNGTVNEKYFRYNDYRHIHEYHDKELLLWDKNVIFFPRRINGRLFFLHRIRPDIQIVAVTNLDELTTAFWQQYFTTLDEHIVLSPKHTHEVSYIGGGCPPIETAQGWLLIYHSVYDTIGGYVYAACAALLDINNPLKEIARLPYPLFKPELDWELKGEVNNVCFPTGAVVQDDTLYIYYGAADERIACASVNLQALLKELLTNTEKNEKRSAK
jgi:predicted GH43/DUF377 family glycosyl hydrolase